MKRIITGLSAVVLASCGGEEPINDTVKEPAAETEVAPQPAPPPLVRHSYNEEVWYISDGWPGEYPPGFSILESGVTLIGRAQMHTNAPKIISCPVEQNATYHQWNSERTNTDELSYVTVSEKYDIIIGAAGQIDSLSETGPGTLEVWPDDIITYLRYLGEGWSIVEFKGVEREIEESSIANISNFAEAGANTEPDQLWVNIKCADERGTRAWILFDDAVETLGVVLSPILEYGQSADLTEEDRQAVGQIESSGD